MSLSDKLFQWKSKKANDNLAAGMAFLESNAKRNEVVSLNSGLQYEILQAGNGEKPLITDTVTCHYHGTLIDGTIFDSSLQRGIPAVFPLNRVIKGWTEALQLMPVNSKWRLFIPPHLAYGERQVNATIGPNSTLIFEVELIAIN
ncbi:MAG: FKBP-type peptidyl-prolyl cis-trans isomerase [Bacteroidota bacterium]|nr:FKBP-type peptidyl-prolyl cis-trans isomerase [Bacteroidota bacterium]